MRLEEVGERNPEVLAVMADLFKVEVEGKEKGKSTWIQDVTYMSRGGIGHLLIIKKDGKGLFYVGEEIKGWMKGLLLAGIWSKKEERLSRGYAYHRIIKAKGYVYNEIEKEKMDTLRVILNQGIKEARKERLRVKREKEKVRRDEIRKREKKGGIS